MLTIIATQGLETNTSLSQRHKVLKASWEMPVIVMFSAREQRRHLKILASEAGVVGPSEPVAAFRTPIPLHLEHFCHCPSLTLGLPQRI